MIDLEVREGSLVFGVRVLPRSSRSEVVGEHDGALKVKLTAPPVGGAANRELVRLLAKELGVPKGAVRIVGGEASRTKRVAVTGVDEAGFRSVCG